MPPVARSAWQRPGQPATPSACPWQRGIERPPGCCRFAQCPGPRLPFPPAAERTAVPSRRPPPRRRERAPPRGSRAIGQAASGPQTRSLRNLKDGRKEKKKLEANPLDKGACLRDCLQPLQLGPAASRDREARQRTRLLTLHVVQSQQTRVERYPRVAVFEGSPGQVICCAQRGSRGVEEEVGNCGLRHSATQHGAASSRCGKAALTEVRLGAAAQCKRSWAALLDEGAQQLGRFGRLPGQQQGGSSGEPGIRTASRKGGLPSFPSGLGAALRHRASCAVVRWGSGGGRR